jgi:hypothetical protein
MKLSLFILGSLVCFGTFAHAENQASDISLVLSQPQISELGQLPQSRITAIAPLNNGVRDYKVSYNNGSDCFVIASVVLSCGQSGCVSEVHSISEPSCIKSLWNTVSSEGLTL